MNSRLLRFIGPLFGLAAFAAALALLASELRGERIRDVFGEISAIPTSHVVAAILLSALSYAVLTGYDALSLRYARRKLPYRRIALASFINYAFSQTLGFPLLTGGAVRFRLYTSWGLSTLQVTSLVAFASFSFWLGVLFVGGLVFVNAPPAIATLLHMPRDLVRSIGIVALVLAGLYLWWTVVGRRVARIREWRFRRPSWRLGLAQLVIAALDWVVVCGVLYVLLPTRAGVPFTTFLGVFLVAAVAGLVSNVPGGLGVFESVVILLMPAQVPEAALLGSLVAFRAIYYLLPLAIAATLLGSFEALRQRRGIARLAGTFGRWVPVLAPSVFAVSTLLAGVILLASGATPSTTGRLRWINELLPLPVIEASHFLASMAGIGLVLLASGLQRRLDAAWHLTVVLLFTGIFTSLLKGLDYEEAIALAIMLAAILPARAQFHRKASLFAEPFTTGWTTAVGLVLLGTFWLGYVSYRNVQWTSELWWRFAWSGDAPRFLRASVGVTAVVLIFALRHLLRPSAAHAVLPTPEAIAQAQAIVARAPDTLTALALLGDKSLLFSQSGESFLMYAIEGRSWIALGDPVGKTDERAELAWQFRELSDRAGGWTVFYLAGRDGLPVYVDLGLTLFKVGEEARVRLEDFSLDGRARKGMRRVMNTMGRAGGTFALLPVEDVTAHLDELRIISDRWLAAKHTREKRFSLGSFRDDYIRRFPAAVVRAGGRIVAFANVLRGADRHELSIDLMRYDPAVAPDGTMEYLLIELMLWGRANGYQWFNLGMAPLSGLESRKLAPLWNRVGALVFRLGEHFYNFRGLRQFKAQFDPVWEPRYIASPGGLPLPRVVTNIASLIAGGLKGVVSR